MKKALKITLSVLAWVLLIFALLITIMVFTSDKNNGVPSLFGRMPLTVESGSMEPTFKEGDLIISKEIDDINELKVDDVISFWTNEIVEGQNVINTHRIVEIKKDENGTRSFITKGDNNEQNDTYVVYASKIIGKWTGTRMAGIGKAMKFLKTKTGFLVCILIPMALFFLFELFKLVMVIVQMRQQPAAITETDEEEIKKRAIEEYLAEQNKLKAQQESGEDKQPAEQKEQVPDKEASEEGAESTETSEASEQ
jgi:signal peptidase